MDSVAAIVPARDAAETLRYCLEPLLKLRSAAILSEVVVVDDCSTDGTGALAAALGAAVVAGTGGGPGAARNVGWRSTAAGRLWFIDADCVPTQQTLELLGVALHPPDVGASGGSYTNATPDRWHSTMIQAEIEARHRQVGINVAMLGSFNLLCRRSALERVGGFSELLKTGEDAHLSYSLNAHGYVLRRVPDATVAHFHEARFTRYLRRQAEHGFYRVALHRQFPGHAAGDGYVMLGDTLAILAALLLAVALVGLTIGGSVWQPSAAAMFLVGVHVPLAMRIAKRGRLGLALIYPAWAGVRACARAAGVVAGTVNLLR